MITRYIHLKPNSDLSDIPHFDLFRCLLIIESRVTDDWQSQVSEWIVKSNCFYMIAWGDGCRDWHNSVDIVSVKLALAGAIPEDKHVYTSDHFEESLHEAVFFCKYCAHPDYEEEFDTLILHISNSNKEEEYMKLYEET